jgi:tetratricopeptide (TPR) repeat protein
MTRSYVNKWVAAFVVTLCSLASFGQTTGEDFKIALPEHRGQLRWSAKGFRPIEWSAKANKAEIGVRAENADQHRTFLAFLFLVSGQSPLTSSKCRDGALDPEKKDNPTFNILNSSEIMGQDGLPIEVVSYSARRKDGRAVYSERGFVATGDMCGDIELYADAPFPTQDPGLREIFSSYRLDPTYAPQFYDVFAYSEILYNHHEYAAVGPLFELALAKLQAKPEGDVKTMTRVLTDQAGMAYGISGNTAKARALFENAITHDPDYPLYYYNLACADASEKNLTAARDHLQKAFARRANILPGELIPDPTKDDSFLPFQSDKEFWAFLKSLSSGS